MAFAYEGNNNNKFPRKLSQYAGDIAALTPYFSQKSVRRLEPVINGKLANLLYRMNGGRPPVPMNLAFIGRRCPDMEDCDAAFFDNLRPSQLAHLGTQLYWLRALMMGMPPAVTTALVPKMGEVTGFV
ncbi:hypothetical protein F4779DRAFT_621010 [Xylariaceae sp. FL0662B]|nr:hypothetical protein F4779DRAFT_621010 [Xylariaceae sp. FL0662B]